MKNILLTFIIASLAILTTNVQAQRIEKGKRLSKQDYADRSRQQRNTAWILLGGGALAVAGGAILFDRNFDIWDESTDNAEVGGVVLMAAGGLSMASSIFLFSRAMDNKERSREMSAFIKIEQATQINGQNLYLLKFPAVGILWHPVRRH
jgi:hypothetical protein